MYRLSHPLRAGRRLAAVSQDESSFARAAGRVGIGRVRTFAMSRQLSEIDGHAVRGGREWRTRRIERGIFDVLCARHASEE